MERHAVQDEEDEPFEDHVEVGWFPNDRGGESVLLRRPTSAGVGAGVRTTSLRVPTLDDIVKGYLVASRVPDDERDE